MFSQNRASDFSSFGRSKDNPLRERLAYISLGYQVPITTGDNFMGRGLKGDEGFNSKIQLNIYKQFFVGTHVGVNYFNVKDISVVGNYSRSTVTENYFYLGYEFWPARDFRLGVSASLFGEAVFKNKYREDSENIFQRDVGNLNSYGIYVMYEIGRHFMVFIDYAYRTSKTKINTPSELNAVFAKGHFHNISLGINFSIGSGDLLSRFID